MVHRSHTEVHTVWLCAVLNFFLNEDLVRRFFTFNGSASHVRMALAGNVALVPLSLHRTVSRLPRGTPSRDVTGKCRSAGGPDGLTVSRTPNAAGYVVERKVLRPQSGSI